ncbi:hypothetical protein H0E87_023213 [Populus deltoides]|uniref:non-specific serine/threonine protein kinase n=1 Tax=Populus deltoides TaxID=3696 RepID=A0A8T2XDX9_POPDE|nr:hypothetical protein H0E87_023213 [Populus deltoides]
MFLFQFKSFLLVLLLTLSDSCFRSADCLEISHRNLVEDPCPLNINFIRELVSAAHPKRSFIAVPKQCQFVHDGIRFIRSVYLRTNRYFVPPADTFQACWQSYRKVIHEVSDGLDIQFGCGYQADWISKGCMNITSLAQFESKFPKSKLQEMKLYCKQSLDDDLVCDYCTKKLLSLGNQYLHSPRPENASDCPGYLFMYTAAVINQFGPTDPGTAKCLFRLKYSMKSTAYRFHSAVVPGIVVGSMLGVVGGFIAVWFRRTQRGRSEKEKVSPEDGEVSLDLGFGLHSRGTNMVKFRIEEIRKATMNFSRHNIIGRGGYGNVYKGMLSDGSEVAFKRFKNCSASGAATFAHEVGIIASVRHVNLVSIRGYCTTTVPPEAPQRIIVCDLMRNGSLYNHLFESGKTKLSWPIRQKIAIGTARGLAYLHYGVHPAIIHRDIKASNILLDDSFEPKVADFGLARFNSRGMTHFSTRVAGTLGYVAPEYALFGQLTERSDVFGFGVVLLELLSGKKAYEINEGNVSLLTDWAWSLAREGRGLDIIEENLPEMGSPEVMEQYVHIALTCAHPLLHARPTFDQIVNMLETNMPVPSSLEADIAASSLEICSISSSYNFTSSIRSDENQFRQFV